MNDDVTPPRRPIRFPHDMSPLLLTVVHTEEEFDWSAPFDSSKTAITHLSELGRAQDIFARHGAKPTYAVDFSVAGQESGIRAIKAVTQGTQATIGAHLHPWINPPIDEEITTRNSYPGNLPPALEREKLRRLSDQITAAYGTRPTVYLAGRYGFGDHTLAILQELGYRVDLSGVAMTDYGHDGGPDYEAWDNSCFWEGAPAILRIPHNVADVGWLCRDARRPFRVDRSAFLRRLHVGGILSRCGAMSRIRLTPEGFTLSQLEACARALVAAGSRILIFSFHSPSLAPGFTPYVRDRRDLSEFLVRIDGFLRFFRGEIGGVCGLPDDALAAAAAASPP
jgi:hypothetical protein